MKNQIIKTILAFAALLALQTGCNSNEPQTADTKPPVLNLHDTLKVYLTAQKMEVAAYSLVKKGAYDSAISGYTQCIAFLNKAMEENNHKGSVLYASVMVQANEGLVAVYDYLNKPENAINCTLECLKWARLTNDYRGQIAVDIKVADRLKKLAENTTADTAKKEMFREALQYALAGARVIDSLKTNDMDDLRYTAFQSVSNVYAASGDKKQAQLYDKKYKEVYFKIYHKQPQ